MFKLKTLLGQFFHSGCSIWTMQRLDESLDLDVKVLRNNYILRISVESEVLIGPHNNQVALRERKDLQAYTQILNIIMNQAMGSIDGMC